MKKKLRFQGIPRFSPECFAKLELRDPLKRKQLQKGIKELTEEGLVQAFVDPKVGWQDPILGVVGVLQFDVLMFRLKDEYKVEARLNRLPYALARWLKAVDDSKKIEDLGLRTKCYHDQQEQNVMLFKSQWEYEFTQKEAGEKLDWFLTSDMR